MTSRGRSQAREAGELLRSKGYDKKLSACFTSELERAWETAEICLEAIKTKVEIERDWRLNERHYGALQGLNKTETTAQHGADQVKIWRRSYDIPPPAVNKEDDRHPIHDPRYQSLLTNELPATESLKTTLNRVQPYWENQIVPQLKTGRNVLITAHGNSLRALAKMLESVSDEAITEFNIPTGVPRIYELDKDLNPIRAEYLGDSESIAAAARAVADQAKT